MFPRQLHDGVHVAGPARQMHHNQRPGAGRDQRPDGVCRDVLRHWVNVGDDRHTAPDDRRTGRGNVGAAGGDDLVSVAYPEGVQGEFECQRAIVQSDGVPDTQVFGVFSLELAGFVSRPVIDFSRLHDCGDGLDFIGFKDGPAGEGNGNWRQE